MQKLIEELSQLPQVEAIALGGSRSTTVFDEKSDYDVYVYATSDIKESVRRTILQKHCQYIEIGNNFWELEDNCTLNNGIDIDILYRNLEDIVFQIDNVVTKFQAHNGYTTCLWHNLVTCKILYDKNGRLKKIQDQYSVAYPQQLKENIVRRQLLLLCDGMPAYTTQIEKAARREDLVSVNHRVAEYLASYFDLLFAINGKTHPGEKRLVQLCKQQCSVLPNDFEKNINKLFELMFDKHRVEELIATIRCINEEVKKIATK